MLVELIKNGYGNDQQLNCAQKILHAANEAYQLELSKDALLLSGGFGGGMGIESTCGALTAGVMVLGKLFPFTDQESKKHLYALTREYMETYNAKMNAIDCKQLKEMYRNETTGCKNVIIEAAIILDSIIQRELEKTQ